jgi:hypothetical protein
MINPGNLDYYKIISELLNLRNVDSIEILIDYYTKTHGNLFLDRLKVETLKYQSGATGLNSSKKIIIDYCDKLIKDSKIKEQRINDKLKYDSWLAKFRWYPIIISTASIIFAGIALFKGCTNKQTDKNKIQNSVYKLDTISQKTLNNMHK